MDSQIKGIEGEKFVNQLAFSTFFKYWCYPSPKYENGNKKEICDLLIIFNNISILFSVKNYEFKGNHLRYFNNTISKATKQLNGAYKILFSDKSIEIKHPDRTENELFPKEKIEKVFRIIVNLGENVKFYPFNSITTNNHYVTLFDKTSFETIINELDTIPDFIDYIEKREILFKNKFTIILPADEHDFSIQTQQDFFQIATKELEKSLQTVLLSGSEKDLLAHFFENKRSFPKVLNKDGIDSFYLILDGKWKEFINKKEFENKKDADQISYFIDKFVEKELLLNINPYREKIATHLLSFDRLARRSISESYFDFYAQNMNNTGLFFGRRILDFGNIGILFTSYTDDMTIEMINTFNQLSVESFNVHLKYKHTTIILISTNKNHSFRFALIENIKPYSKEQENIIIKDIKTLGWFTNMTEGQFLSKEFPE